LEEIIHPVVIDKITEEISRFRKKQNRTIVVLDVPLLFEAGLNSYVDWTIVVKATQKKQMEWSTRKLKIPNSEAQRRIKAQWSLKKKVRMADFIIDNEGNINTLRKKVDEIWQIISQKKKRQSKG